MDGLAAGMLTQHGLRLDTMKMHTIQILVLNLLKISGHLFVIVTITKLMFGLDTVKPILKCFVLNTISFIGILFSGLNTLNNPIELGVQKIQHFDAKKRLEFDCR